MPRFRLHIYHWMLLIAIAAVYFLNARIIWDFYTRPETFRIPRYIPPPIPPASAPEAPQREPRPRTRPERIA